MRLHYSTIENFSHETTEYFNTEEPHAADDNNEEDEEKEEDDNDMDNQTSRAATAREDLPRTDNPVTVHRLHPCGRPSRKQEAVKTALRSLIKHP